MKEKDKKINQSRKNERGAVIIEAAIALPVFMFVMITLYSLIQIAYVQARMTIAADCAAKEIAEYTHVFYATGMAGIYTSGNGKSSEIAQEVSNFLEKMAEKAGSVSNELGEFISGAAKAVSNENITDEAKNAAGRGLGERLMRKNMVSGFNDTADAFMKRNRIKNLNMEGTSYLTKSSKSVFLQANYDIEVIKLLNIDFSFHMSTCAYTEAWGGE